MEGRSVLDASALLAALFGEPGSGLVEECIEQAIMSAVNLSEVARQRRPRRPLCLAGSPSPALRSGSGNAGSCTAMPDQARWPVARRSGLSCAGNLRGRSGSHDGPCLVTRGARYWCRSCLGQIAPVSTLSCPWIRERGKTTSRRAAAVRRAAGRRCTQRPRRPLRRPARTGS